MKIYLSKNINNILKNLVNYINNKWDFVIPLHKIASNHIKKFIRINKKSQIQIQFYNNQKKKKNSQKNIKKNQLQEVELMEWLKV